MRSTRVAAAAGGGRPSARYTPATPRPAHGNNLYQRLLDRELDRKVAHNFTKRSVHERFSRFRLCAVCDVYAPDLLSQLPSVDMMMERRSRILEIVVAGGAHSI